MPNNDYILRSDALKAILGVSIYDTKEELEGARTMAENTWADGLYDAYKIIEEEVDAADVEPVRHGRWVSKEGIYGVVYCSICDFELKIDNTPRCPHCGAKMDAEPPKEENDDLD